MDSISARACVCRKGFTLLEALIVLTMLGSLAAISMPRISAAIRQARLNRAATVMANDLQLALSLAARQRQPVQISASVATQTYRFTDRSSGTVLHQRTLGSGSDYHITSLSFSVAVLDVLPTGTVSGPLEIKVQTESGSRTISMSSAGQIRVSQS